MYSSSATTSLVKRDSFFFDGFFLPFPICSCFGFFIVCLLKVVVEVLFRLSVCRLTHDRHPFLWLAAVSALRAGIRASSCTDTSPLSRAGPAADPREWYLESFFSFDYSSEELSAVRSVYGAIIPYRQSCRYQ